MKHLFALRPQTFAVVVVLWLFGNSRCGMTSEAVPGRLARPETSTNRTPALKLERPGLKNFHQISSNLFRCAQPTGRGMRELEALGIKTVINLRPFHSDRTEAKGTSLRCERISFQTWHPEDTDVIQFLKMVTATNRGPFVVHCLHGSDRTGTMVAIYRIAIEGWTKEEAIAEMTRSEFGFHAMWKNLIQYLRALDIDKIKRKTGLK